MLSSSILKRGGEDWEGVREKETKEELEDEGDC